MSSEEETELRDLVAHTLEFNGCLPKLRAELRASIFLTLDENVELQKAEPFLNKKLKAQLETQEGQNMFCLVREFLEYFGLDFTISVYEPESYLGSRYNYAGRGKVVEDLKIPELKDNSLPLLLQLIRIAQLKTKSQCNSIEINLSNMQNIDNENETSLDLSNKSKCDQSSDISSKSDIVLSEELEQIELKLNNVMNGTIDYIEEANPNTNMLNSTFNLSTPSIYITNKIKASDNVDNSPHLVDVSKVEDTFDETSSSEDKSQNISSETEFSPPILKDKSYSKYDTTFDKQKLSSQKGDKLKTKSSLASLADLPPLQLNKSRTDAVLLPSLYIKDFKEKSANQNLKEIDKLFDIEPLDNYEEDFLSDSEINNTSVTSKKNCSIEFQPPCVPDSSKYSNKSNNNSTSSKDSNPNTIPKDKTEDSVNRRGFYNDDISRNNSESSSVTSDDLNRNVDEILNSATSN